MGTMEDIDESKGGASFTPRTGLLDMLLAKGFYAKRPKTFCCDDRRTPAASFVQSEAARISRERFDLESPHFM